MRRLGPNHWVYAVLCIACLAAMYCLSMIASGTWTRGN